MSEERSWRDRGKQAMKKAGDSVKGTTSALSGKTLEEQVAQYSELYTQVLLGLHDDLKALERKVEEQEVEIAELQKRLSVLD